MSREESKCLVWCLSWVFVVWYGYNAGYLTAVADGMMCVAAGPGTNCLQCMQPEPRAECQLPAWLH